MTIKWHKKRKPEHSYKFRTTARQTKVASQTERDRAIEFETKRLAAPREAETAAQKERAERSDSDWL